MLLQAQLRLTGIEATDIKYPQGTILIAEDLHPSDMADLDREQGVGFCTLAGGATSHAAILAQSMGISTIASTEPRVIDPVALTRLRVEVTDPQAIKDDAFNAAGVEALIRLQDQVLHLVVGLNAEQYAREIEAMLSLLREQLTHCCLPGGPR